MYGDLKDIGTTTKKKKKNPKQIAFMLFKQRSNKLMKNWQDERV